MTQDMKDITTIRSLFWNFYYRKITLAEMQESIKVIMGRQLKLIPEARQLI